MTKDVRILQDKLIDYCGEKHSRRLYLKELVAQGALDQNKTYEEVANIIRLYLSSFAICPEGRERALKGLGLFEKQKRKGITRYVIDVEYELREDNQGYGGGIYGERGGNSDCGTVMLGAEVMIEAILGKESINNNKPLNAHIRAYRTNVEKVDTFTQSLLG